LTNVELRSKILYLEEKGDENRNINNQEKGNISSLRFTEGKLAKIAAGFDRARTNFVTYFGGADQDQVGFSNPRQIFRYVFGS
jgi:hypothetical protein